MNPRLGRVQEAVVLDRLDDPEVFVAGRGLHDLFPGGNLDERGVTHLRPDGDDVIGVIVNDSGGALGKAESRCTGQQNSNQSVKFHGFSGYAVCGMNGNSWASFFRPDRKSTRLNSS